MRGRDIFCPRRADQDAQPDAGGGRGRDVARFVADQRRGRQVESEIGGGLQDHAGAGLAPGMVEPVGAEPELRVIRAVIDPGDRRPLGGEARAHPPGQFLERRLVEQPAADAGLVRHHHHRPAHAGRVTRQCENPRHELELLAPVDVAVVDVDDAVAVEKQRRPRRGGR